VVPEAPLERTENGAAPSGEGWTEHIFVRVGGGPCLVPRVGARRKGRGIRYPVSELALRYGAGVETETSDPNEAYARFGDDKPVPCPDEFPSK